MQRVHTDVKHVRNQLELGLSWSKPVFGLFLVSLVERLGLNRWRRHIRAADVHIAVPLWVEVQEVAPAMIAVALMDAAQLLKSLCFCACRWIRVALP